MRGTNRSCVRERGTASFEHLSGQFHEHQHLTVTIEDTDESARWLADADPTATPRGRASGPR